MKCPISPNIPSLFCGYNSWKLAQAICQAHFTAWPFEIVCNEESAYQVDNVTVLWLELTVSLNAMYWSTTSIFQDEGSAKLPEKKLDDKEEKIHKLSKWVQHEYVTLDDVKCE